MAEFVLDGIQTEMNYETNAMYFVHRFTKKDDNQDFITSTMYCTMEEMKNVAFGNIQGFVIEECGKRLGKDDEAIRLEIKKTESNLEIVNVTFEYSKSYAFVISGHVSFEADELEDVQYGKISNKVVEKLHALLNK